MKLMGYFLPFMKALNDQLEQDQERWGDEWKKRPIEHNDEWRHQNIRVWERIEDYFMEWIDNGTPVPWLKICGNAFIAWVREYDPEGYMLEEETDVEKT